MNDDPLYGRGGTQPPPRKVTEVGWIKWWRDADGAEHTEFKPNAVHTRDEERALIESVVAQFLTPRR